MRSRLLSLLTLTALLSGGCGTDASTISPQTPVPPTVSEEASSGPIRAEFGELDESGVQTPMVRSTYKFFQINPDGSLSDYNSGTNYLMLLDSQDVLEVAGRIEEDPPIPRSEIENFLRNEWQAFDAAPQVDFVTDFVSELRSEAQGDFDLFYRFYRSSGVPLATYMADLRAATDLADDPGLDDLITFLDFLGISLGQFEAELARNGMTGAQFLQQVDARGEDFADLMELYGNYDFASREAFYLGALAGDKPEKPKDPPVIQLLKFAWDFVKDNRPESTAEGAFTFALSNVDKDPLAYSGAKESRTSRYYWYIENLFGDELCRVEYRGEATYDARNAKFLGSYLPSIAVEPLLVYAEFSWKIDASVAASNVSNIGGDYANAANPPNPLMNLTARITFSGIFSSTTKTIRFRVTGREGISRAAD